eukprot:TRINITY_DN7442_c0_g1_i3.p1 TRINITY_DN7442_c0_g1~~TRINITY_DN7442_c0_g1_i3.p1  ORF type:complete len:595 (+),score=136.27 TRINITY_DN7442_c0_g1_i3:141-1925(+)
MCIRDRYQANAVTGVQTVLDMESIEIDYLGCLIVLFTHIVIDRVIYLKADHKAKTLLTGATVAILHIVMLTTMKLQADQPKFRHTIVATYYLLECGYLYFSATQIQCHYPANTHQDFLLSIDEHPVELPDDFGKKKDDLAEDRELLLHSIELRPGRPSYFAYMGLRAIPFLFELRCILDWWFIPTTLDLIEYIKLCDLHGIIFSVAYLRNIENTSDNRYVGELMLWWYKHLAGGLVFILLVVIIWGPLFIFSGVSPFLTENASTFVGVEVNLASGTITEVLAYSQKSYQLTKLSDLDGGLAHRNNLGTKPNQINQIVDFYTVSSENFDAPTSLVSALVFDTIRYKFSISRPAPAGFEDVEFKSSLELDAAAQNSLRQAFITAGAALTAGTPAAATFNLGAAYPDVLACQAKFCNVQNTYNHVLSGAVNTDGKSLWISFHVAGTAGLQNAITNDGVATGIFADDNYSVGGLYITVVLVVANVLRTALKGIAMKIQFTDMEDVRVPVFLCSTIAKARKAGNFYVEHELYLNLIQLFRRPELLWKYTTKLPDKNENEQRLNGPWDNKNLDRIEGVEGAKRKETLRMRARKLANNYGC